MEQLTAMVQSLSVTIETLRERQDADEAAKKDAPTPEKPGQDKQTEGDTAGAPAEDQRVPTFQGTREDRESAEDYARTELLSVALQAGNPYTAGGKTTARPGSLWGRVVPRLRAAAAANRPRGKPPMPPAAPWPRPRGR